MVLHVEGAQLLTSAGKEAGPQSQRPMGVQQPWNLSAGMRFQSNVGRISLGI
jgi:hypothetical protein